MNLFRYDIEFQNNNDANFCGGLKKNQNTRKLNLDNKTSTNFCYPHKFDYDVQLTTEVLGQLGSSNCTRGRYLVKSALLMMLIELIIIFKTYRTIL